MLLAGRQINKRREVTVGIQTNMQLGHPLGLTVNRLREHRQNQFDQRGIEQEDLALELECLVIGGQCVAEQPSIFWNRAS
jgi:hypothetical protein